MSHPWTPERARQARAAREKNRPIHLDALERQLDAADANHDAHWAEVERRLRARWAAEDATSEVTDG